MMFNNEKPALLAMLLCEKVLIDESQVPTLIRVVDTFTFNLAEEPVHDGEPPMLLIECVLFTKWGPAMGEFTEEIRLVRPNGTEVPSPRPGLHFTMPGVFHFQQVRHEIRIGVTEDGFYAWRVYLDGEKMGEHPFRVSIIVKPPQGSDVSEQAEN